MTPPLETMTRLRIPLLPVALLAAACSGPRNDALAEPDPVDALIAEGRLLLREGEADEALHRFEQASERDGASAESRVWLVRGWLAQDRIDDSLQATDELAAAGAPQPDLDYLYGLGFHARAARAVASGSGNAYTQGEFEDALRFLSKAIEADGDRYADAWLPLAESSWYAQDLPGATEAVLRAVELEPEVPAAHLMHGRIAFSRYSQARDEGASAEVLDARWQEALDAFAAARRTGLERGDDGGRAQACEAARQIGMLRVWKEDLDGAAVAFGDAMVLDPWTTDYNGVIGYVGLERFVDQVERARAELADRDDDSPLLLAWWAGFGQFGLGRMAEAERSFTAVIEGHPDFAGSAWYYLFRASYGQRSFADAVAALRTSWHQDPDGLAALLESDRDINLAILEYLVGWLVDEEKQPDGARPREAAILAEIMTRMKPDEARYWNNLGLFLRDAGEALELERPAPREEDLQPLWEQAYAAYEHTLELEPDNAGYLNDTAVMLQYHLNRDLDRAAEMYARAAELAAAELARDDLPAAQREWMRTAERDAHNNLKLLREQLAGAASERD